MDPFTQVKSAEHMAKNQFQMHIWGFSFTTMSKCRKRPWNLYKCRNSLFKTYFPWPESAEGTSSFFRNLSLPRLVQNKPSARIRREENKVGSIERQFYSEKVSFVYKRETEYILLNLSFHLCLLSEYFQSWIPNFSLENHHMRNARHPCFWRITVTY